MIQKPVDPMNILNFVRTLHGRTNNLDLTQMIVSGNYEANDNIFGELTGANVNGLPTGAEYYQVINGRAWQVLPKERAEQFISSALAYVPKDSKVWNSMMFNLTAFLATRTKENDRVVGEKNGVILQDGDNAYYVRAIIQGNKVVEYEALKYDNGIVYLDDDSKVRIPVTGSLFDYNFVCRTLFNKDAVNTKFMRTVMFKGATTPSFQQFTANDTIFILFGNSQIDDDVLRNAVWSDPKFIDGVYVQDIAGDFLAHGSAYRRFVGNKSGYYIDTAYKGTL